MLLGSETPRIFTPPLRPLTPQTSRGYAVAQFADEVLETPLLPWQRWLLIHGLELLPDGTPRFRTVILLVARQNGKTTALQVLSLWAMYVAGVDLIIGTAQDLDTAEEVWDGAVNMAKGVPEMAAEIAAVSMSNGKKALELTTGAKYKVKAASRKSARGLSSDLILMDELREHTKWDAWSAVSKTRQARPNAQLWGPSNAGDSQSVVLAHLRRMAHAALGDPDKFVGDTAQPREPDDTLGIFEWSAPPGCDVWDRSGWAQANPSLGYTISERTIASDAATDPEGTFRTEVLCQWVDRLADSPDELNPTTWAACLRPGARPEGRLVLGVDVAPWKASASIVACGLGDDGVPVLELVDTRPRTDWLPQRVADLVARHDVVEVVVDPSGPVGAVLSDLDAAGVVVRELRPLDAVRATTAINAAAAAGEVAHRGQSALDVAVAGAVRRKSGDGARWSRTDSEVDISPLVAATWAAWAWIADQTAEYDVLESAY